jgi:hypothetical protein
MAVCIHGLSREDVEIWNLKLWRWFTQCLGVEGLTCSKIGKRFRREFDISFELLNVFIHLRGKRVLGSVRKCRRSNSRASSKVLLLRDKVLSFELTRELVNFMAGGGGGADGSGRSLNRALPYGLSLCRSIKLVQLIISTNKWHEGWKSIKKQF